MPMLGTKACPAPGIKELCANVMFLVAGFDEKNLNLVPIQCIHSTVESLLYF